MRRSFVAGLFCMLLLVGDPASPQGCSQCRETVGQTPARTQSAYRKAILLMAMASGGVFTAGIVLMRRFR